MFTHTFLSLYLCNFSPYLAEDILGVSCATYSSDLIVSTLISQGGQLSKVTSSSPGTKSAPQIHNKEELHLHIFILFVQHGEGEPEQDTDIIFLFLMKRDTYPLFTFIIIVFPA